MNNSILSLPSSSSTTHYHQHEQQRYMSSDGDLPYHIVVGMPALSPTMTSGSISKWNVSVGSTFSAGDSLAVIETDKATIDFEAQDDGVVARILVEEGGGEVDCGLPIMVTVEEEEDVKAFEGFTPDAGSNAGGEEAAAPVEEAPATTPAAATLTEDLPYHIVVGMPALSPTMEAGTISNWNVSEGQSFSAGDSLAVIETDKATIDFEAQDDGVVAKIIVEAGSGEVGVGVPIMVTVEEEEDVMAFKDFVVGSSSSGAPPEEVEAPTAADTTPAVEEVATTTTPEPVAAAAAPTTPAAPTTVTAEPVSASPPTPSVEGAVSLGGSSWGQLAAERSPLARALASKQKEYIEKYGSTGHVPIV